MEICVMSLTGRVATLDVESSMTIEDVKWIISGKGPEIVPPDLQALIFAAEKLKDGLTLADYNIQHKSRLTLTLSFGGEVRAPV